MSGISEEADFYQEIQEITAQAALNCLAFSSGLFINLSEKIFSQFPCPKL